MRQRALIDQLGLAQLTQINVARTAVMALFGAARSSFVSRSLPPQRDCYPGLISDVRAAHYQGAAIYRLVWRSWPVPNTAMLWPNPIYEMQPPRLQSPRGRTMVSSRFKFLLCFAWIVFARSAFVSSAKAQVVLIPGGDYESDFEKVLVVIISLVLLLFAARYSYRNGQLDFALNWFAERVRRIFRR